MSHTPLPTCSYCGSAPHHGVCPRVKAFEYHADGFTLKRVEFHDPRSPPKSGGLNAEQDYALRKLASKK